ncbi:Anp1-domain-containing protein, partial [Apiospora arundinis]
CDGKRPNCLVCRERGITNCTYIITTKDDSLQLLRLLRSLPKDQATCLLASFRNGMDVASLLTIFPTADERPPLAMEHEEKSDPPQTSQLQLPKNHLELESIPKNSHAYPTLSVINVHNLAQSHLLRPVQSLRSKRRRSVCDYPYLAAVMAPELLTHKLTVLHTTQFGCEMNLRMVMCQYLPNWSKPIHPSRTNTAMNAFEALTLASELTLKCISLYLITDHPLFGFFDPHLFIGDLVDQQEKFCSRFLVNALLHLGCMYCAFDESVDQLVHFFLEEAERLWEIEKEDDTLLTMAGAAMLSQAHMGQGQYHSGHIYAQEVTRIGVSLGLFGPDSLAAPTSNDDSASANHLARCYAAWGGFNWNAHVSLFYRRPGTKRPICPPKLPIPGGSKFAVHDTGASSVMDTTFQTLCEFWQIIQRAGWFYYADLDDATDHSTRKLTEYHFHEIIAWIETLPLTSLRSEGCSHHVIVSHIWMHAAIIDILRPVLKSSSYRNEPMRTSSASESLPELAHNASVNQLKSLLMEYRTNYEEAEYSVLWHTGLLHLANAVLHETENADWRVYFMFCIYGYETLRRPYPVSEVLMQGLQSMCERHTDSPDTGTHFLLHQLTEHGLQYVKDDISNKIRATFLVGSTLALEGNSWEDGK